MVVAEEFTYVLIIVLAPLTTDSTEHDTGWFCATLVTGSQVICMLPVPV